MLDDHVKNMIFTTKNLFRKKKIQPLQNNTYFYYWSFYRWPFCSNHHWSRRYNT